MGVHSFFPTNVYKAPLQKNTKYINNLNKQLLKEVFLLAEEDKAGIAWSKQNYPNGFTSYASANQMHVISPTFSELEAHIKKHVQNYISALELNIKASQLSMSTCWVNIMPSGALHTSHNHPQSVISGTYYVQVPKHASAIRFEDPRYTQFMSRPAIKINAKNQALHSLSAQPGDVILFESWLRHEVPLNNSKAPRISISFNY